METDNLTPEETPETDWKALARKWEARAKENKAALDNIQTSTSSEMQVLLEKVNNLEKENFTHKVTQVASKFNIPALLAGRLQGSTIEELEADAKTLAETLGLSSSEKQEQTESVETTNTTPQEVVTPAKPATPATETEKVKSFEAAKKAFVLKQQGVDPTPFAGGPISSMEEMLAVLAAQKN